MALSQRDVRNRIGSVKNIQKITRAMEMVAAARLRRAEQRIAALRPYAAAIARMTRRAARAGGQGPNPQPLMVEREVGTVGLLLVCGDRGLAGAFNSQVIRAGLAAAAEQRSQGRAVVWYVSGRRGVSSLTFRGETVTGAYVGFSDRPAFADARRIAEDVIAAYVDRKVDRVELIYNRFVSPLVQRVQREVLLPVAATTLQLEKAEEEEPKALVTVEYEPDPAAILARLVPSYVEIAIFRALLESTASEHGARMTAMRNASENAGELIDQLTLEMNRARQAEITQEILEVVAGAEAL